MGRIVLSRLEQSKKLRVSIIGIGAFGGRCGWWRWRGASGSQASITKPLSFFIFKYYYSLNFSLIYFILFNDLKNNNNFLKIHGIIKRMAKLIINTLFQKYP